MRQRVIVILLVGVLLLTFYTLAFKTRGSAVKGKVVSPYYLSSLTTEVTRSSQDQGGTSQVKSESLLTSPRGPQGYQEPVEWGSDPFVREWILFSEVANLDLRAITVTSSGASALINNQILQVGDEIMGKRIVKIEEDKVTLEQGGRTFTLTLGE